MNSTSQEKVVKCKNDKCGLHFGYSEKKTKCPFCYAEYVKVEEKPENLSAPAGALAGGQASKKGTTKTQKESFKIWKDN